VSKEPQAEGLHPIGDWQAPVDTPDCLVGNLVVCLVYRIRKIFRKHQVSKASRRFSRVLVTVRFTSIEQDWEYVGPVELHLRLRTYMRPPDILLEEEEAIPCDSDASQYLKTQPSLPNAPKLLPEHYCTVSLNSDTCSLCECFQLHVFEIEMALL